MRVGPAWWGFAGLTTVILASPAFASADNPVRQGSPSAVQIRPYTQVFHVQSPVSHGVKARERAWRRMAAVRISHDLAMRRVARAGIGWHASGRCTDHNRPWCTSLHGIRFGTVLKTVELKERSGCRVVITGGTETGHARGFYSHGNGYKVDIQLNACVDAYITRNMEYYKTRGDGARLYRNRENDIYAREPDHWDVLFR
ncbi:hypothetical protein [Acrocarpospora catenulata]|uniref:hypothetical protein n=1 Tax=Acrocarpospora catenulata TaxID=2836182 RepID=UPI001BDA21AB|nr:hypothetical protein [Acrocarpospora catenulata]